MIKERAQASFTVNIHITVSIRKSYVTHIVEFLSHRREYSDVMKTSLTQVYILTTDDMTALLHDY